MTKADMWWSTHAVGWRESTNKMSSMLVLQRKSKQARGEGIVRERKEGNKRGDCGEVGDQIGAVHMLSTGADGEEKSESWREGGWRPGWDA